MHMLILVLKKRKDRLAWYISTLIFSMAQVTKQWLRWVSSHCLFLWTKSGPVASVQVSSALIHTVHVLLYQKELSRDITAQDELIHTGVCVCLCTCFYILLFFYATADEVHRSRVLFKQQIQSLQPLDRLALDRKHRLLESVFSLLCL